MKQSKIYLVLLQQNNVDNSGMRFDHGARTALAFVTLRADGERVFLFFRNPSADMLLRESKLNKNLMKKVKFILTKVVPAWLSCLPIIGDLIEAKVVHDQLCSMAERSERELLVGYLPKIVSIFAEVLCAGKDLASEQTASRMINLLRQLRQTVPSSTLASAWSSLQPQQQLTLQSFLSS